MKILSKKGDFNFLRCKIAFTMSETLVVMAVLGIVASILIPGIISHQIEAQNKVKIRKAMVTYNSLMSKIISENRLSSQQALTAWATANTNSDCENSFSYIKAKELIDGSHCKVVLSDGVAFDLTDITNPVIALKPEDLKKINAAGENKTFKFLAEIDANGKLRVNDITKAGGKDKADLINLYLFLGYDVSEYEAKQ